MKNRGFTLIELLVVISIISLLSSVVLASVQDAREKAKDSKFRQEVYQFINALELYKLDKGYYPGEDLDAKEYGITRNLMDGQIYNYGYAVFENGAVNIPYDRWTTAMSNYISSFPTPTQNNYQFNYAHTEEPYHLDTSKCSGDSSIKPYVIIVYSNSSTFDDWPHALMDGTEDLNSRCFSLK